MAQFDVFENPNREQRGGFPYLVVLQSDHFDHYATRLVMPLSRMAQVPRNLPRRLAERVVVRGEALHASAHLCAAVPAKLLKRPVLSLREQAASIRDALDAVLSGV